MDLQLVKRSLLDYTTKNKKWVAVFAALGLSSFAAYRVYHFPSIAQKRARISKLLGALVSIVEVISDSADTVGVISRDLKEFLQSESDQIPNSITQISKVARSIEFSESVISLTQALTLGILRGYKSNGAKSNGGPSFFDKVFDKLTTQSGSGFVSVVVGSFAKNLVMGFYQSDEMNSDVEDNSVAKWVDLICSDRCKELIGGSIQLFVSTAVAVYLDKTMHINTFDEVFAALANPKHEKKVKDMFVTVCNGAIETLVKTSHQVLTSANSEPPNSTDPPNSNPAIVDFDEGESGEEEDPKSGWMGKVSSTLAVPSNRRLVLDVTGRVTFETVRSFLEFLVGKLVEGVKRCVDYVNETGHGVVRFVGEKSSVMVTIWLSLCLHILDGAWVLVPA